MTKIAQQTQDYFSFVCSSKYKKLETNNSVAFDVLFLFSFCFFKYYLFPLTQNCCFLNFFSKTVKEEKTQKFAQFSRKKHTILVARKNQIYQTCLSTNVEKNIKNSIFSKKLFAKHLRFAFFLNSRFKIQMSLFESRCENNVTFIFCKMTVFLSLFLKICKKAKMYKCKNCPYKKQKH